MAARRSLLLVVVAGLVSVVGCASPVDDAEAGEGAETSEEAVSSAIAFQATAFVKEGAPAGTTLIQTGKQFEQFFGTPAVGIDFSKEWLVHYSLGPSANGTTITPTRLTVTGPRTNKRLLLAAKRSTPGAGCTSGTATAQISLRFKRQVAIRGVDAAETTETVACPLDSAWKDVDIAAGWVTTATARDCYGSKGTCSTEAYGLGCVVELGQTRQITCYAGYYGSVSAAIAADGSFHTAGRLGSSEEDVWDVSGRITADRRIHIERYALEHNSLSSDFSHVNWTGMFFEDGWSAPVTPCARAGSACAGSAHPR